MTSDKCSSSSSSESGARRSKSGSRAVVAAAVASGSFAPVGAKKITALTKAGCRSVIFTMFEPSPIVHLEKRHRVKNPIFEIHLGSKIIKTVGDSTKGFESVTLPYEGELELLLLAKSRKNNELGRHLFSLKPIRNCLSYYEGIVELSKHGLVVGTATIRLNFSKKVVKKVSNKPGLLRFCTGSNTVDMKTDILLAQYEGPFSMCIKNTPIETRRLDPVLVTAGIRSKSSDERVVAIRRSRSDSSAKRKKRSMSSSDELQRGSLSTGFQGLPPSSKVGNGNNVVVKVLKVKSSSSSSSSSSSTKRVAVVAATTPVAAVVAAAVVASPPSRSSSSSKVIRAAVPPARVRRSDSSCSRSCSAGGRRKVKKDDAVVVVKKDDAVIVAKKVDGAVVGAAVVASPPSRSSTSDSSRMIRTAPVPAGRIEHSDSSISRSCSAGGRRKVRKVRKQKSNGSSFSCGSRKSKKAKAGVVVVADKK